MSTPVRNVDRWYYLADTSKQRSVPEPCKWIAASQAWLQLPGTECYYATQEEAYRMGFRIVGFVPTFGQVTEIRELLVKLRDEKVKLHMWDSDVLTEKTTASKGALISKRIMEILE